MYKTYQVKKREIYSTVLSKINKHIDELEDLGELEKKRDNDSKNILSKYSHKEISKKRLKQLHSPRKNL